MKKITIVLLGTFVILGFLPTASAGTVSEQLAGIENPDMLFISMTEIRNSDGETFGTSAANIQEAIDQCSTPGTVWLPSGTYNPSSTITINQGITLDLCGAVIRPSSNYGNIIEMEKDSHLWNGFVDCSQISMSDDYAAIYLSGFSGDVSGDTIQTIKNMRLDSKTNVHDNWYGTGVYLHATSGSCQRALFSKLFIHGFEFGIKMKADGGNIKENLFKYIGGHANHYNIYIEAVGNSQIYDNMFDLTMWQSGFPEYWSGSPGVTENNIRMHGNCYNNLFREMLFWDYARNMLPYGKMSVDLDAPTHDNYLEWFGGNEGDGQTPGNTQFYDYGTNNIKWMLPIYNPPSQRDSYEYLDDMQDAYHTTVEGSGTWLGLSSPYYLFTEPSQIINSKGNTFSDIQSALNNLGGQPGTVWVPKATYLVSSPGITVPANTFLDLMGSTIVPQTAMNVITLGQGAMVMNGIIDCSGVDLADDQSPIRVANILHQSYKLGAIIDNMALLSHEQRGTGMYLFANQIPSSVCWVYSTRIYVDGFKYGIQLHTIQSGNWDLYVNGNAFRYITINDCEYPIYLLGYDYTNPPVAEVTGNIFTFVIINPSPNGGTLRGFFTQGGACQFTDKMWILNYNDAMRAYGRKSIEDHTTGGTFFEWCGGTQSNPPDYIIDHIGNWDTRIKVIPDGTPIPDEMPDLSATMTEDYYIQLSGYESPQISGVTRTTSDPLDTSPAYGWVNVSCTVTDNVGVSQVILRIHTPSGSWNNVSMTAGGSGKYYYRSTTAFSILGNYSYSILARDTSNNVATSGAVLFSMPPNWDMNSDGVITVLDFVLISNHYGQSGANGWIREDADNSGDIEVLDMVFVSSHFGEEWWV
ncbi:hypothetical protein AYK25_07785 [Thermoplasmatales archaeon SM1-50]|nr:MAG: hypothetical protein AYK25_07785 [Thermoplasmatales archaeon SM1-50]